MDETPTPSEGDASAPARPAARGGFVRWWPWALAAVVVLALVLRLPGLSEGPAWGNRDEASYVPKAVRYGGGDLNPHYFQNPPLAGWLMFAGIAVRYAWGRLAGDYASALDFKAQFLADGADAYGAARIVALLLGLACVVQTALLARSLVPRSASDRARAWAGVLAAIGLAASPLHVLRSSNATNETLVTLAYPLAVQAAVLLVRAGTMRAALVAGAAAGLAAASKYTGAMACVPVGIAALLVAEGGAGRRAKLCAAAAGASVAAFLVACPFAVLDAATFRAHVLDLMVQRDRWGDDRGWLRYAATAWGEGLGPVWCVAAAAGVAVAARRTLRAGAEDRRVAAVALLGAVPLTVYLASHTQMANGRYLMPVYPVLLAIGAAALVTWETGAGVWLRRAFAAAVVACAVWQNADLPARFERSRAVDTHATLAAWLHANLPDGAQVVVDWWAPQLPQAAARREFEGRVPQATLDRFTPAFRVTTAYSYFRDPLARLDGTDVPVGDFDALRAHAPVWFVLSEDGERTFGKLSPDDYPALAWYRAVRERLPVVHEERPGPGRRGPIYSVHVLR